VRTHGKGERKIPGPEGADPRVQGPTWLGQPHSGWHCRGCRGSMGFHDYSRFTALR